MKFMSEGMAESNWPNTREWDATRGTAVRQRIDGRSIHCDGGL